MSVASRTLSVDAPATPRLFTLPCRGLVRAVSTVALWCRRAHDRRRLAILSPSFSSFLLGTGLVCTEADMWLRDWALKTRRRVSNDECDGAGPKGRAISAASLGTHQ
jgi:hypothetical protein